MGQKRGLSGAFVLEYIINPDSKTSIRDLPTHPTSGGPALPYDRLREAYRRTKGAAKEEGDVLAHAAARKLLRGVMETARVMARAELITDSPYSDYLSDLKMRQDEERGKALLETLQLIEAQ